MRISNTGILTKCRGCCPRVIRCRNLSVENLWIKCGDHGTLQFEIATFEKNIFDLQDSVAETSASGKSRKSGNRRRSYRTGRSLSTNRQEREDRLCVCDGFRRWEDPTYDEDLACRTSNEAVGLDMKIHRR